LLLAASPLAGQRGIRELHEWGQSGFAFNYAEPVGLMGSYVDWAGGADMFFAMDLGPLPVGLRFEGGLLAHELSVRETGGGPYDAHTTSFSFIGSLRAGPQITIGPRSMRLYGLALIGPSYFGTTRYTSTYDCGCSDYSDTETLSGDWTWGAEVGGGMQFQMGPRESSVMLDLGLRLVRHQDARYLGAGPVVNGFRTYQAAHGPAEYFIFKLGMTFPLR
jgi:hypothetical protein